MHSDMPRILVFIPMYNCAPQINRVLEQLKTPSAQRHISGVLCINNLSSDNTEEEAKAGLAGLTEIKHRTLLRNNANYGLGGSHKVAIRFAQEHDYDFLVVLHGDDQGSIDDLLPELETGRFLNYDFLMGARFMRGSHLQGYSLLRTLANKAFNTIFSLISRKCLYDLGSGLNLFRVSAFKNNFHIRFADDLTFNYYLILNIVSHHFRLGFFPLTWREDDQVSNAKLSRMGFQILRLLLQRIASPASFMKGEHRILPRSDYPSTVITSWGDTTRNNTNKNINRRISGR